MNDVISRDYWPKEWPDWPEDPKVRKVVGGLYEIGLFILKAPASCRKFRLEQAEKRAQKYLSQMTEKEREQAGALVHLWERNALIQQRIRYEENKNGIDAANHLYPEWRSAGDQMDRAEKEASQLGLAANEYFQSRVEQFKILEEEKDEVGQYHNLPDYSDLRRQWYAREPITEPLPWPWEYMLMLCKRFEASGYRAKKWLTDRKLAICSIILAIFSIIREEDEIVEAVIAAILDIF
jgi:hypothetical protein